MTQHISQSGLQMDVLQLITELTEIVERLSGRPETADLRKHIAITRERVMQFWSEQQ